MKFLNQHFIKREEATPDGGAEGGTPAPAQEPAGGTPPAVTPPVEPVVAPVVEPVVEQTSYDTPASKQIHDAVVAAGLDSTKVFEAIQANGGELTIELYQKLAAKHGEGLTSLIAGQLSKLHNDGVTKATAADEAIYSQLEVAFKDLTEQKGSETFKELQTWAKENVDQANRDQINALLKQGGLAAQLAVQELVTAYKESGDYTQPAELMTGDNRPTNKAGGDLTRQEYSTEVQKLLDKGHDYNSSAAIKSLQARRRRSL